MLQITGRLRMTSIEISDLVGSRHDSVKRTVERRLETSLKPTYNPTPDPPHGGFFVALLS